MRRAAVLLLVTGVVAACSGPPEVERDFSTSPRDARLALELLAAEGPVPARVVGFPFVDTTRGSPSDALAVVADGVPALTVRFVEEPDSTARTFLVLAYNQRPGASPCPPPGVDLEPAPATDAFQRVSLAMCDGPVAVGAVRGEAIAGTADSGELARTYRRLSRALFPSLYNERYGLGVGPFRFGLNTTFGF
ncbi:MAG: hypothetical protein AAFX81_20360 [Pseudomonadota bacterium]